MALLDLLAGVLRVLGLAVRGLALGVAAAVATLSRGVRRARERGGAGEPGMVRLLDLHAASIAGDTLIAIGLAGTVFFTVPAGEARGRVALYLLVTMLPFAVLAPVVGPVLDRFRHGRRYALATTFLGRAVLAYLISEHIGGLALYPAAFGILVLSRAYGVARSAAVPRLLPGRLALSEANARASLFGTVAAAAVAPIGILAASGFGQQWPLRLATVIFLYGVVTAVRLPPRADSDPPEAVPRLLRWRGSKGPRALSGPLVVATVTGGATLRAAFGFLTLYLAFGVRSGDLDTDLFDRTVREPVAIGLLAAALGTGSLLATAVGTRVRIRRPARLLAVAIGLTAAAAGIAAWRYGLPATVLLCLIAAAASGVAKLCVDAVVQERTDERTRASAFAHAETILMLAWVGGGALGLIPFGGRLGLLLLAAALVAGTARAAQSAVRLRRETLRGRRDPAAVDPTTEVLTPKTPAQRRPDPAPQPTAQPAPQPAAQPAAQPAGGSAAGSSPGAVLGPPAARAADPEPTRPDSTLREPADPEATGREPTRPTRTRVLPVSVDVGEDDEEPPGFHLYRPTGRPDPEP